jgi:hypothetical protein
MGGMSLSMANCSPIISANNKNQQKKAKQHQPQNKQFN